MPATDNHQASLIDLPTLAERLGVNQRHIRRLVAERRIPFIKWGHLIRFDPVEVDAWLNQHRREPEIPVSGPAVGATTSTRRQPAPTS